MAITPEQIERRDFSLVQIFYHRPRPVSKEHPAGWEHEMRRIIVGSPSAPVARRIARAYAAMHWEAPEEIEEIVAYPRNYIQDARRMVARGECIQGPEEANAAA